jgi:flagellar biogenesis protein FliO
MLPLRKGLGSEMFGILLGLELPRPASLVIAFLVVAALIGVTAWLVRRFGANRLGGSARGRQPRRLTVLDAARVDKNRSVVLIRRDNIEHLLMIGGPTDMVIEPNIVRVIGAQERVRPAAPAPAPPTAHKLPAAPTWRLDKSAVPPRPVEHFSSPSQRRLAELAHRLNAMDRSSASVAQPPEPTKGAAGQKLYGNLEDDLATLLGRAGGSRGDA